MKKIVSVVLILAFAMCLLGGCSRDTSQIYNTTESEKNSESADLSSAETDYVFEDEVLVGRVVPSTGVLRAFGEGTPYMEESAIAAINARGGVMIDGKRCSLKLVCKDSGSTVDGAKEAAMELIDEGIDIMIVSNTADTVIPVSTVCEREGVACISVDAPASAWAMGGPYANSWHSFFDNEREMLCFLDAWNQIDSNKKIGLMTANDSEGIEISTFIHDFAASKGYTIVDAGAYYVGENDFSDYINTFKEADCDIILGVMVSDDFEHFWTQLSETDYRPKMCTIAKACLFESSIEKLGDLGDGLITEVWWTGDFPFVSSIDGTTSAELAEDYLENVQTDIKQAPPTVGYKYANVEILYDILKRAGTLDLDAINESASQTDLDTIVGHVHFNEDHISLMSCVTGQWILDEDGTYHQEIVGNYLIPSVDVTAEIKTLN